MGMLPGRFFRETGSDGCLSFHEESGPAGSVAILPNDPVLLAEPVLTNYHKLRLRTFLGRPTLNSAIRERFGMTRKVLIATLAVVAMGLHAASVRAQDSLLAELYGQGVHAYNSRNYQQAHEYLAQAIDQGSKDPRCFYFRGLSYYGMGHLDAAKLDYDTAAMMEAKGGARVYPVSRSLQRIQGAARLTLEKHRRAARLAVRQESLNVRRARYEAQQRAEGEVLRDPSRKPEATARELLGPPQGQSQDDPFGAPAEKPKPAAPKPKPADVAKPAPVTPGETDAPAAQPAAGDTPASDDPFGGDTPSDDPFGGETPPSDDPFGGGTPSDDPFGGDTNDDPFKDDSSSDDDPFGGTS